LGLDELLGLDEFLGLDGLLGLDELLGLDGLLKASFKCNVFVAPQSFYCANERTSAFKSNFFSFPFHK
jgi:hypothetical protein